MQGDRAGERKRQMELSLTIFEARMESEIDEI